MHSMTYYTQEVKDNLFTTTQNTGITKNGIQSTNVIQGSTVQSTSIKFVKIACELELPDQELSTNNLVSTSDQSKINDIQDCKIFQDTMVQNASTTTDLNVTTQNVVIISTLDALSLDTSITTDTVSETVESLRAYEKRSGDAQKFLDCMGNNFRWPAMMPNLIRILIFRAFIDIDNDISEDNQECTDDGILKDDQEYTCNYIYLYNSFDQGMFGGYEKDWTLVYNPKVKKYELEKCTN
ncbi:4342_t:CDS:2 [Diversispora eburnea]|uniref:4342_t:CDS:1 n=1 Tax=Diversispora eburnea TaxID=1213867 RepID=A0A9N8ZYI9_9GLOM|nr:4342_t:CDS:2 [Diversispora eburnea]